MQILTNTPGTIELQVFQAGDLTDLDTDPTVAFTDANGTAVSSGTVSKPGATTGIYRSTLPGQVNPAELTAVWSGTLGGETVEFTQHHEIVGSLLFTESQARSKTITGAQTPLSDGNTYPDALIASMRELITDQFESKTTRSWITRYCRMELHGSGSRELNLTYGHPLDVNGNISGGPGRLYDIQSLISVSIDGTLAALADFTLHGRRIIRNTTWPLGTNDNPFRVVVEYEYGVEPVDLEAQENALRMALANLVPSDLSAYALTSTVGVESLSFPQQHGGFVWPPKVWEWLQRNPPRRVPVVA